jgi:uncharacterized protein (TIGR03086 family)
MSTQPLQQAVNSTRAVLSNVTAEQLAATTPCASWNVGELIDHIIGGHVFFAAGVSGEPPVGADAEYSSGDFMAAFDEATAKSLAAFGGEGVMEQMITMPFGEMPGSALMGLAATDTFTHGWDLAKATGQSTDMEPEFAAGMLAQSKTAISDAFRGPEGAPFGAEQQAGEGATNADQLAAFLGRTV